MDEDAGSLAGVSSPEHQPLVDNHEHQVAKETEQEEQLRKKQQVDVKLLLEVPEGREQSLGIEEMIRVVLMIAPFTCSSKQYIVL